MGITNDVMPNTKPFRDQDLLDAVRVALDRDRTRREQEKEVADLRQRFASLTSREQEVVSMVAAGMLNKQIAAQLGTARKVPLRFSVAGRWRRCHRLPS